MFLVFTAIRVHAVIRARRARRNPSPAASADGAAVDAAAQAQAQAQAQPQAQAQAGTGSRPRPDVPEKEHNAWGQAVAAVAVFGALGWRCGWPHASCRPTTTPRSPPRVRAEQHEKLPKAYKDTPRPVTGEELCKALNRPDLAKLLGTPEETATTVSSTNNTAPLTDGKVAQPEAEVTFDTYTVNVSATYNELSTDQYVKLMKFGDEKDVKTLTVLGRPAVLSSDHTMKLEINLGSGGSGGPVEQAPWPGHCPWPWTVRTEAATATSPCGACRVALPNDSALLNIAEVLPGSPNDLSDGRPQVLGERDPRSSRACGDRISLVELHYWLLLRHNDDVPRLSGPEPTSRRRRPQAGVRRW